MTAADLLADFADVDQMAKAINRSPRTVKRLLKDGVLPFTKIGSKVIIHIPSAQKALASRVVQKNAPRRPRRANGTAE